MKFTESLGDNLFWRCVLAARYRRLPVFHRLLVVFFTLIPWLIYCLAMHFEAAADSFGESEKEGGCDTGD
jgi:hypothetical protein